MTEKKYKAFICCGDCDPKCGKCGEQQTVEFTPEEYAQAELDAVASAQAEAERVAAEETLAALKASAKAKLIAGQPLTAEEADTLVI
jgi:hypothetical protein